MARAKMPSDFDESVKPPDKAEPSRGQKPAVFRFPDLLKWDRVKWLCPLRGSVFLPQTCTAKARHLEQIREAS
jgi:hypothetical protein